MSKRNFILLIIVLVIAIIAVFGFLYLNQPPTTGTANNPGGTNFFAQFNPFGNVKPATPVVTTPVNVSGYTPSAPVAPVKLNKISSMPIAGFTVFSKQRLVAIAPSAGSGQATPAIAPLADTSITSNPTQTLPLSGEGNNTSTVATPPAKGDTGGLKKTSTKKPTPPPTEFAPALRYVARATGNIYETFADDIAEGQFTTTVIPKVYDAYFGNSGNGVVMRYLKTDEKTIETFFGNLPKEVLGADTIANNELKGSLLPDNVKDVSISPDASSIFYLFNSGDNMIGTTMNLASGKKVQIFNSPFTEWLSDWPNSKLITLTTKPASSVPGYMFTMDSSGKNFAQVLGGINGLTTLTSPDGKLVLFGDSTLSLNVYNTATNTSSILGVKTLPEKCVWGSGSDVVYCAVPKSITPGQYPDSWYQGEVSFSDQIWEINIKTGNTTMLIDPVTVSGGEDIDGIKLALDPGANYLFFINKKDSFLWELSLK